MVLRRWEPLTQLRRMEEEMDQAWRQFFRLPFGEVFPHWTTDEAHMPLDIYSTDDHLVVRVSLPGVKSEDVEITFTGNTLTLKGESKMDREVNEDNYMLREHHYGAFSRTITLPSGLQTDKAEASYQNGVLTISIPKSEEVRPKSLKINVKATEDNKKK